MSFQLRAVQRIYDHRHLDGQLPEFLTLYEGKEIAYWVEFWEFLSYDDEEEPIFTQAFYDYCARTRGISIDDFVLSREQVAYYVEEQYPEGRNGPRQ